MRNIITALLAATALTAPALADDSHIRTVNYDATARVQIVNTIGRATNITFADNEEFISVVFGKPGTWEGPAPEKGKDMVLKNNLPLWPKQVGRGNLIVVTQDDKGVQHSYQFDLEARPERDDDDPAATYGLIYKYPAREAAQRAEKAQATTQAQRAAWAATQAIRQDAAARVRQVQDQAAAPRNWRYTGRGDVSLAPVSIYDDGQRTFLRYQGQMAVPSVFTVAPDGSEQAVRPSMDGDMLVVPKVADELHLRLGSAVLYVFNRAYNPIGLNPATGFQADPGTGTGSPNVVRELRRASIQ